MSIEDLAKMIDIATAVLLVFGVSLAFTLFYKLEKIYDELKEIRREMKEQEKTK